MQLTVECKQRPSHSKPNALRREGLIPAALYGHKGAGSEALVLNANAAQLLLKNATINNTLVQVKLPDTAWQGQALVREVQANPVSGALYHISFFSVADQDSLEVTVPLNFTGEAVGVSEERGSLDTVLTELAVQCAPDDIPDSIEINVSHLKVGDVLSVQELVVPSGVTVLGEPERTIATVLPPRVSAVETDTDEETNPDVEAVMAAYGGSADEAESPN